MKWLLRKRSIAILSFAVGIVLTAFYFTRKEAEAAVHENQPTSHIPAIAEQGYKIKRLEGYNYIRPVITVESEEEALSLVPIKQALMELTDSLRKAGTIKEMSVYLKNPATGEWTSTNPEVKYNPASLMKVPLMLAWLKMAEASPSLLKESIVYQPQPTMKVEEQFFKDKSLEPGQSYSLHDLLYYMMAYSDNHATQVLSQRVDAKTVTGIFNKLGLAVPDPKEDKYLLTAPEFSLILSSIFNSTFLSPEYAEYGAEMMANCNFKEGFKKGFPPNTKMWHKFGERSGIGQEAELHESGVIYLSDKPFLITVMSKGIAQPQLAKAIQRVCQEIHAPFLP